MLFFLVEICYPITMAVITKTIIKVLETVNYIVVVITAFVLAALVFVGITIIGLVVIPHFLTDCLLAFLS